MKIEDKHIETATLVEIDGVQTVIIAGVKLAQLETPPLMG